MQLAGELAKMNLASLIRLVRNGELTGKICLTQGVNSAYIFVENGQPIHVEADTGSGREALLELFLWQNGSFSYIECPVGGTPRSLSPDEPLERLLKEGSSYQEALRYLEQLRISSRTFFQSADTNTDDFFLAKMDGKTPLGVLVQSLGLTRSQYILKLQSLVASGRALVVEPPRESDKIELPEWVRSRLRQDNPDVSQAIVDLVIWADRMKCWLYQTDVDLQRVIATLDPTAIIEESQPEPTFEQELPQQLASQTNYQVQSAAYENEMAGGQAGAAAQPGEAMPNRPQPRPPSYDF
ncbi:MAG: DUF4388 domain-containing protein [Candidatus Obscuribacterales bacterium]|nr:DUF4388 domain-containing protein [Candidatus Obscuribacterales bacterium]